MFELQTLGALRLLQDGSELNALSAQQRRLLVVAIVAASGPVGVSRARLLSLLWPESDDARARNALKQARFALRRELAVDLLAGDATLRLDDTICRSDIGTLLEAAQRGDDRAVAATPDALFLDGTFGGATGELDEWIAATRRRIDSLVDHALRRDAERATTVGKLDEAIALLRRLAERRPLDADIAERTIRTLAAAGDASAALQHAALHESTVLRELRLPPDPRVSDAERDVRASAARDVLASIGAARDAARPLPGAEERADSSRQGSDSPPPVGIPTRDAPRVRKRVSRATVVVGAAAMLLLAGALAFARRGQAEPELEPVRVLLPPVLHADAPDDLARAAGDLLASAAADLNRVRSPRQPPVRIILRDLAVIDTAAAVAAARSPWLLRGSLLADGSHVTLTASLIDPARGTTVATGTATGPRAELAAMALRVAAAALEPLLDARARTLVRVASLESRNHAALEAYLLGVASTRQRRYEDAVRHFERAVREDSSFAMAWFRLATACNWASHVDCWNFASGRAGALADRLPEHEQLMLRAGRAFAENYDEAERIYQRLVTRYPDDAEAWYQLGELHFHFNPPRGRSPVEGRADYLRAAQADDNNPEVWEHLARLAALAGDRVAVDSFSRRALASDTVPSSQARMFGALMGTSDRMRDSMVRAIPGVDEFAASVVIERVLAYGGDHALVDRLYEQLSVRSPATSTRTWATIQRAVVAAGDGRVQRALALLRSVDASAPTETRMAWRMLRAIPLLELPPAPPHVSAAGTNSFRGSREPLLWYFRGGPLEWQPALAATLDAASSGSVQDWDRAIAFMGPLATSDTVHGPWHAAVFASARALASGQVSHAAPADKPASVFLMTRPVGRWLQARTFVARGQLADAVTMFGSFDYIEALEAAWGTPARYERARLLEKLGRSAEAIADYRDFERRWAGADPALQVHVADARKRRERLLAAR